jgi:hypothetical protein
MEFTECCGSRKYHTHIGEEPDHLVSIISVELKVSKLKLRRRKKNTSGLKRGPQGLFLRWDM